MRSQTRKRVNFLVDAECREVRSKKTVTAFLGTYSKKHTWSAVQRFTELLQSLGDVDCEIVPIGDYELETCRGCKLCFEKREEFCPLKDDRDALIEKMALSDGVVFASPNYAFHASACMKIFLDRLAFFLHRPFSSERLLQASLRKASTAGDK